MIADLQRLTSITTEQTYRLDAKLICNLEGGQHIA
jgi:hypothetical protein